jgi:[ribosomal protein S5]-alanine N-acetyltransferase
MNTSSKVIIYGKKVILRPFKINDITDNFSSYLNDNEVVKYSNQQFIHHTKDSCTHYMKSFENTNNLYLAIEDMVSGDLFGTMTAYIDINHNTADIGILIGNKNAWGLGIGTESWSLLMNFLFESKNIRKVTGGTLQVNKGMINIMKKNGMKHEATKKGQELINNKPVNMFYFCKFNLE